MMAYFDNGNKLFDDARKNQYAIGAYNINNLEWTRAILRAAAETSTPVLIQARHTPVTTRRQRH